MVALGIFQALLNGIGWILSWIYDLVGSFGVSIILLTVLIRVVLLGAGMATKKGCSHGIFGHVHTYGPFSYSAYSTRHML